MRLQHVSIGIAPGGEDAARAFYGGVLGLEQREMPAPVDPKLFIWYRIGDGLDLHLHVLAAEDPPAARDHFCLIVDEDLATVRARIEAAGVATRDPVAWPGRPSFYCRDPFGNQIEFAQTVE